MGSRRAIVAGPPAGRLVADDTGDGRKGPKVYVHDRARHPDAVRRPHRPAARARVGRPAVLVKFPFATCRWAVPVRVDLGQTPEVSTV